MLQIKNTLGGGGKPEGFYVWKKYESTPDPYLSFLGNGEFTLKTFNTSKNWNGTLEYSTDTTTWNTWNGTEISSSGNKLYLRGTGNSVITGASIVNYRFTFTGSDTLRISCEGNIETLLDYATVIAGSHPTMGSNCFTYLFSHCNCLTTAPELPATTLAIDCYNSMFNSCTNLTTAPELPATTLSDGCYKYMFNNCTSLITAPELPATTLANSCYLYMFNNCTSLTTAPELPATTLANNCYEGIFRNCKSLTTAPELPATILAGYCYKDMFRNCTSLTTAPELPATILAECCYEYMFYNCSKLTILPSILPATTLTDYCYAYMFEFTAIDAIPQIMAITYALGSCECMFDDIKTLNVYSTSGTDHTYGWTAPTSAADYCSGMFGSDDGESEWAKLDGLNFPNGGTPTDGTIYYFKTVV